MNPEKMRNLITMMETGVQRLREADSDMAVLRVLRTMAAVCNHQANHIERNHCSRIDSALVQHNLIEALREEA